MTTDTNALIEDRLRDLLRRPYRKVIEGDPDDGFLARAPELPGCVTAGETEEEALAMLHDAMAAWLESALRDGAPIPEPDASRRFNGKILLRLAPSLHRDLAMRADEEGVSINQFAATLIARGLGN